MSATNKRRGPGSGPNPYLMVGLSGGILATLALLWGAAALGAVLGGRPVPPGLFALPFALASGDYAWPGTGATVALAVAVLVLAAAAVFLVRTLQQSRRRRQRIDAAAAHMGKGDELAKISRAGVEATAARLGAADRNPGVFLGRTVIGRQAVYGSVEDCHVDIWGPRTGKTTRKAIPALMEHGAAPALATSNKRDLVDATRQPRAAHGTVWVFDPQQVIGESSSWYWNPLSYVVNDRTAASLAEHFAMDVRGSDAKTDAYFEPAGQELLANLLLAAALADRPITQVYTWLSDPKEAEPERILRSHGTRYTMAADSVKGIITAPEKQRGGVYGTARQMATCLRNPDVVEWVTKGTGLAKRQEFDPAAFVRSTDTLYLVSREGKGSAGALVTALTVAVCEAAEEYAAHNRGGRLPRELLGVLDEVANVCRWAELPNLYSHYGSRGIQLMAILQSWDQGVDVWGERGMGKLWSAANVATYGGGVKDTAFLGKLAELVGKWEPLTYSASYQPSHGNAGWFASNRSTSISSREEEIVNVADLGAMPPGRALVIASGTRPTLIETVPWWERDFAAAVQSSLDRHDPGTP